MESPFISQGNPSVNDESHLDVIEEHCKTPSNSDDEVDEIDFPIKKDGKRRQGSVFNITDFHRTRADVVKDVNLKLLPFIQVIFSYVVLLGSVYWAMVIIMPIFYVDLCNMDNHYSLTYFVAVYLLGTTIFEYNSSIIIVKIIQPLSGHTRLGNMQFIKLGLGLLGKLDIYTKYCFMLMAHKCNSEYA